MTPRRKDLVVLRRDYDALMVHAQARGIEPSLVPPAPTVARRSASMT